MEDIFASLARLPTSKRNLRTFRLKFLLHLSSSSANMQWFMIVRWSYLSSNRLANNQCVQMVTALILQLVQCIVAPPLQGRTSSHEEGTSGGEESRTKKLVSSINQSINRPIGSNLHMCIISIL